MKRVLYIHQYFQDPTCNSSSIRSYEVAFALVQNGYDVSVITSSHRNQFNQFKTLLCVPESNNFITVYTLPVSYSNKYSFTRRIFSFVLYSILSTILALFLRAHLIYASSTPLTVALPALVRRLLFRTPFVLEVRDVWPDIPISMGFIRNSFLRYLIQLFSHIAYTKASKIIALSPDMKVRLIRNYGVKPDSCLVATNFFSPKEFPKITSFSAPCPSIITNLKKGGKYIILYSGTLGIVNNPNYIVDLALSIVDLPVCILVIGSGNMESEFKEYAISTNMLNDKIFLLPPMHRSELIPYMYYSDFMISTVKDIPILSENSANKFFESLASHSVTLINHGGWMEQLLTETVSGFSLTQDATVAHARLKSLLSNPSLISTMKSNARSLAVNNFTASKVTSSIVVFLSSLLP